MGIVRFCTLVDYYVDPSPDYGFGQTWGPAYAQLETSIAIITACLPVMYPLLRRWFPRVFGGPGSGKRSGAEEGQRAGYAAGGSGAGEGASVRMRDFGQRRSSVRLWSDSNAESNEELFKPAGIVKTTHVSLLLMGHRSWAVSLTVIRSRSRTPMPKLRIPPESTGRIRLGRRTRLWDSEHGSRNCIWKRSRQEGLLMMVNGCG